MMLCRWNFTVASEMNSLAAIAKWAGGLGYNNPDASFTGPGRTPWNTAYRTIGGGF